MDQLVDVLNFSSNVYFQEVQAHDFFDYCEMLDYFYKKFPNGTIQNKHVFSVSSEHPTKMIVKTTDAADPVEMDFRLSTFSQSLQMRYLTTEDRPEVIRPESEIILRSEQHLRTEEGDPGEWE